MPTEIQKNESRSRSLAVGLLNVRGFTQHQSSGAGFTLIEVMVVMAIISIMAAVVVSSIGNGRTERELETNAREFASVVREAQNYALTGRVITATGIPSTSVPCSFQVTWTITEYSLIYRYKNSSSDDCSSSSAYPVLTYLFKNGVTTSSGGPVDFSLPHAVVSGAGDIIFSKSSLSHAVCISADGHITDHAGGSCS